MSLDVVLERQEKFSLAPETRDVLAGGFLVAQTSLFVRFVRPERTQGNADLEARVPRHAGIREFTRRTVTLDIERGDHERRDIVSVHRFQLFPLRFLLLIQSLLPHLPFRR